jgi:hypothetical protein
METLVEILLSILSYGFAMVLYVVAFGATIAIVAAVFISILTAVEWLKTGKVDQTSISENFPIVVAGVVVVLLWGLLMALGPWLDGLWMP